MRDKGGTVHASSSAQIIDDIEGDDGDAKLPNLSRYELPEIVVVDKQILQTKGGNLGIAGYDHLWDTLYVSNALNFVEDVLVHELSHKEHWDAAKSVYNHSPKKYNNGEEVKRMIDEPIRSYISKQNITTPGCLLEISTDAYLGFMRGSSINEVVAEVMVANKKLSDKKLFSLIEELLKDGNHG